MVIKMRNNRKVEFMERPSAAVGNNKHMKNIKLSINFPETSFLLSP